MSPTPEGSWTFYRSALIFEMPRRFGGSAYPYLRKIASGQDPIVTMNGSQVIMLGSNNYLELTNHPEIKEAAAPALSTYGTGTAGSRFLNGTLDIHVELEDRLAEFWRTSGADLLHRLPGRPRASPA